MAHQVQYTCNIYSDSDPSLHDCWAAGYIAPEVDLSGERTPVEPTSTDMKARDVFAFGITLAAMIRQNQPYPSNESLTPAVLQDAVTHGWRPIDELRGWPAPEGTPPFLLDLMQRCWLETPECRPTFEEASR